MPFDRGPEFPLFVARVRKNGNSFVLTLPLWVRDRLRIIDGTWIAMRLCDPFVVMRAFDMPSVPDANSLPVGSMPPAHVERNTNGKA